MSMQESERRAVSTPEFRSRVDNDTALDYMRVYMCLKDMLGFDVTGISFDQNFPDDNGGRHMNHMVTIEGKDASVVEEIVDHLKDMKTAFRLSNEQFEVGRDQAITKSIRLLKIDRRLKVGAF